MNTAETVTRLIAEMAGINERNIKPEERLDEDLGLDSLDLVELVLSVEAEFAVDIRDEAAEACKTVADVIACVEAAKGGA